MWPQNSQTQKNLLRKWKRTNELILIDIKLRTGKRCEKTELTGRVN